MPHEYDRVVRMAVVGTPQPEPPVSTRLAWPSVARFGSQTHVMTRQLADRLSTYLTGVVPEQARSRYGSDDTLDFAHWTSRGARVTYANAALAALSVVGENATLDISRFKRTGLALGGLGIFGFSQQNGGPEVQSAVVGLGSKNQKCLFGQDGWVGVAPYSTVKKNQVALAGLRMPKTRAVQLELFADPHPLLAE